MLLDLIAPYVIAAISIVVAWYSRRAKVNAEEELEDVKISIKEVTRSQEILRRVTDLESDAITTEFDRLYSTVNRTKP